MKYPHYPPYPPSTINSPLYYWHDNTNAAMASFGSFAKPGSLADMPKKDMAIYGASAVVGALIFKGFIAGPLGILAGAAAGLMGASAVIKGR